MGSNLRAAIFGMRDLPGQRCPRRTSSWPRYLENLHYFYLERHSNVLAGFSRWNSPGRFFSSHSLRTFSATPISSPDPYLQLRLISKREGGRGIESATRNRPTLLLRTTCECARVPMMHHRRKTHRERESGRSAVLHCIRHRPWMSMCYVLHPYGTHTCMYCVIVRWRSVVAFCQLKIRFVRTWGGNTNKSVFSQLTETKEGVFHIRTWDESTNVVRVIAWIESHVFLLVLNWKSFVNEWVTWGDRHVFLVTFLWCYCTTSTQMVARLKES